MRSQSRHLLDRLQLLDGEGATEVARRRQAAVSTELAACRQRQLVATALKQSRAVVPVRFKCSNIYCEAIIARLKTYFLLFMHS